MQPLLRHERDGLVAHVAHTTRADGDVSPSTVAPDLLEARRTSALALPWRAVRQIHSDRVVSASHHDDSSLSPFADGLVTNEPGLALAVHSGDCVPLGFIADSGDIAVAHAGWKGLEAGVVESTVRCLRSRGAEVIRVAVGPHIRVGKYEFGGSDLHRLATRFGPSVIGQTDTGKPALDLTSAVASELAAWGVTAEAWSPDCTATNSEKYWSHRARQESGRLALVAWIEDARDG